MVHRVPTFVLASFYFIFTPLMILSAWLRKLNRNNMKLTDNALTVLTKRDYLKRDKEGRVVETPEKMFRRVATAIARVEESYGPKSSVKLWEKRFYEVMTNLEFLP